MTSNPSAKLPMYVVDTHVLLWYLTADKKLSQTAHTIIKQAINGQANLVIPAVALAELYMIAEKQRTPLVAYYQRPSHREQQTCTDTMVIGESA